MLQPQSGNSAQWIAALANSTPNITAHVNVLRSGNEIANFPVEKIQLTVDRTQVTRRVCTVTIAPQGTTTLDPSWMDLFAAAGNEIRPFAQQTFPDGSVDEVCIGTFTIVETTWLDSGTDIVVTIKAQDRMFLLNESMALVPYAITSSTVDQAIIELVNSVSWGVPIGTNVVPTDASVPSTGALVKPGKTIWSQIQELAAVAGYEAFMDVWGNLVARPIPTPSSQAPVATLTSVTASGLLSAKATSTRKKIFSAFGVVGAGTTEVVSPTTGKMIHKKAAVYAEADDTNPSSPTYVGGGFGKISKLVRSGLVTDQATGDAMAAGLLAQQQGAMTALDITILPFWLLDSWDVVMINAARLGVYGNYVVDGFDATIAIESSMTPSVRQVF